MGARPVNAAYDDEHEDDALDPGEGNPLAAYPCRLEWIPWHRLRIDKRYQRKLNAAHVKGIAAGLNPARLRPLDVSRRGDGGEYVMDGQHRYRAIEAKGWQEHKVLCRVYENLPEGMEQLIFDTQSEAKALLPGDVWRSAMDRRDADVLVIDAMVRRAGFSVDPDSRRTDGGRIGAIKALRRIYRNYQGMVLAETLQNLADCFGTETGPGQAMLEGMARFVSRYEGEYEHRLLVDSFRLPDRKMNLGNFLAEVGALQRVKKKMSAPEAVGRTIVDVYNAKRHGRELDPWDSRKSRGRRPAKG